LLLCTYLSPSLRNFLRNKPHSSRHAILTDHQIRANLAPAARIERHTQGSCLGWRNVYTNHYGMLERQFRKFLDIAKKSKGNTANTLVQLLELRLDNVLRRLGVARTIWACRQIVAHGHVMVNGRKTDIASFRVEPGMTITFKEGITKVLRDNMEQNAGHNVPNWLEWNPAQLTAKVNALPVPEDVPLAMHIHVQLSIVIDDQYRRRMEVVSIRLHWGSVPDCVVAW